MGLRDLKIETERQVENPWEYIIILQTPGPVSPDKITQKLGSASDSETFDDRIFI
jgi:hypothetical protein